MDRQGASRRRRRAAPGRQRRDDVGSSGECLIPACLPELKLWQHEPHALVRSCREAILLHLYRATVGAALSAYFAAPWKTENPWTWPYASAISRVRSIRTARCAGSDVRQHEGSMSRGSLGNRVTQKILGLPGRSDIRRARMMGPGSKAPPRWTKDFGVFVESAPCSG